MHQFLWNSDSLQAALSGGCILHGQCFGNRICIDSRAAARSDIFAALKGEHTDGHHYLEAAFKAGASCALVEQIPKALNGKGNFIVVPNVQEAIRKLAIFNRSRSKAIVLAVTGSVGKTSTKEALHIVCRAAGSSFCSKGNFNNQLGAPISLASMPLASKYAIFELGMNHSGEIKDLTALVKPHLGIITSIENTHIEHFSSVQEIAAAKAEIFSGMYADGVAIINGDTPYYKFLASAADSDGLKKIYSFGKQPSNDCYLIDYNAQSLEHNYIKASIFGHEVSYAIGAQGRHQAMNSIVALAAASVLGIDLIYAIQALLNFTSVQGRGKVLNLKIADKNIRVIDDSYNASPASVRESLLVMREMNHEHILRKIAVLGDMYELGTASVHEHNALLEPFMNSTVNKLVAIGPLMKHLFEQVAPKQQLAYFETYKEAKDNLPSLLEDGDCVLLKGSHGTKVYEIVKHLQALAS
jgi:UDP-N-acetylmuramoyl-tripeptide--D-alanyl-D-alanine ligase